MKKLFLSALLLTATGVALGQGVGINTATPHNSAMLDVVSTNKGILIPRMSSSQRASIMSPATGLLVYQTDLAAGFWYYDGAAWKQLGGGGSGWEITGNTGITTSNFLGTINDAPLIFRVNNERSGYISTSSTGNRNTFFGFQAGKNTTGLRNTYIGHLAGGNSNGDPWWEWDNIAVGHSALYSVNQGFQNIAIGTEALYSNSNGAVNIAIGIEALNKNSNGIRNLAIGKRALYKNTTSSYNIAIGDAALQNLSGVGTYNIAIGFGAASATSTSGSAGFYSNIAIGYYSLSNASGNGVGDNIAIGSHALAQCNICTSNVAIGTYAANDTDGTNNIAIGPSALHSNTNKNRNIAIGSMAIYRANGEENTAIGVEALKGSASMVSINGNVAVGYRALENLNANSNNNVAVGKMAGLTVSAVNLNECTIIGAGSYLTTNRSNVTMLGSNIADAQCTGNNQVLLGNTAVTHIRANVTAISAYSDKRFKSNISEDVKGLDFILRLRPVSYNVNPEILHQIWGTPDSLVKKIDHSEIKNTRFTGLLAQEVHEAMKQSGYTSFTGIDIPRNEKEVYSLRYVDFVMPMIKAIQEQQKMIEALTKENESLKAQKTEIEKLKAEIEAIKKHITSSQEDLARKK